MMGWLLEARQRGGPPLQRAGRRVGEGFHRIRKLMMPKIRLGLELCTRGLSHTPL